MRLGVTLDQFEMMPADLRLRVIDEWLPKDSWWVDLEFLDEGLVRALAIVKDRGGRAVWFRDDIGHWGVVMAWRTVTMPRPPSGLLEYAWECSRSTSELNGQGDA